MTSAFPFASASIDTPAYRSAPPKYALLSEARLANSVSEAATTSTIQLARFMRPPGSR